MINTLKTYWKQLLLVSLFTELLITGSIILLVKGVEGYGMLIGILMMIGMGWVYLLVKYGLSFLVGLLFLKFVFMKKESKSVLLRSSFFVIIGGILFNALFFTVPDIIREDFYESSDGMVVGEDTIYDVKVKWSEKLKNYDTSNENEFGTGSIQNGYTTSKFEKNLRKYVEKHQTYPKTIKEINALDDRYTFTETKEGTYEATMAMLTEKESIHVLTFKNNGFSIVGAGRDGKLETKDDSTLTLSQKEQNISTKLLLKK